MEITPEYLATLPEWIADIIKSNNITEVYDTEIDFMKWPGDFPVRIMRFGEPFILYQDEDDHLNLIKKDSNNSIIEYHDVYPVKYSSSKLEEVNNLEAFSWIYDVPKITKDE